jgi:hypothetical protein
MAFLQSQRVNRMADYLNRGREYSSLQKRDLMNKWVAAFKGLAAHAASPDPKITRLEEDLAAEIALRGLDEPFYRVMGDMDRFVKANDQVLEELKRDPEALEAHNKALQADIDAYKQARDKSN